MKKTSLLSFACMATLAAAAHATEFHVALNGNDTNSGTFDAPLRTIQHGADLAQPGDTVIVHAGTYRERINPPRGGESDAKRIVYEAATGEKVEIKGSEIAKNWVKVQGDVWKVTVPNSFFGTFNPYSDILHGDWFERNGRDTHSGEVYLNGDSLIEAAKLDDLLKVSKSPKQSVAPGLWFAKVEKDQTTIWAQFPNVDPNGQLVEINVRQTVFYPDHEGCNYITLRGFILSHAATPWAPPTAEQIGLVGTHWSKGWVIENNTISHSTCVGIALGKYGDEWDNKAGSATGYVGTINRALKHGWSMERIGHHVVRNNNISFCEQAGVVGSLGAIGSTVSGNSIHDIHVQNLFEGPETAGIKFHGAIDVEISHNHIFRAHRHGIWLDWMAQGARISGNLLHDNNSDDLFFEVNHGPLLVDNNILLSKRVLTSFSQGLAFVHNLCAGRIDVKPYDNRKTPFHKAHSTEIAGMHDNLCGDDRYYNNVFVGGVDLNVYGKEKKSLPVWMDGNVYLKGAKPSPQEAKALLFESFDPGLKLVEMKDGYYLSLNFDPAWITKKERKLVTTRLLGKAVIPDVPFELRDGKPIRIDTDYFSKSRNSENPAPGPFETFKGGERQMKVWPIDS